MALFSRQRFIFRANEVNNLALPTSWGKMFTYVTDLYSMGYGANQNLLLYPQNHPRA